MDIDLAAANAFMATHARILDRRRFQLLSGQADRSSVLAALRAYRNPDGGYGHGLEPDLRAPESQPAAALHALEVFAEIAPVTAPEAAQLCDWVDAIALPDGGLPFALPIKDPSGCAPFWADADPRAFSLQITAIVAANAHRVAEHDSAVAAHPWLAKATSRCLSIRNKELNPWVRSGLRSPRLDSEACRPSADVREEGQLDLGKLRGLQAIDQEGFPS